MAIQLVESKKASALERLVDDYLANCTARGLSPRSVDRAYGYALYTIFLPWCESEDIRDLSELDRRTIDRFTSSLHNHRKANGELLSKYSVHTYIRPVRQLLTWASSVGEDIQAKPQLPRRSKPIRDVLSRKELDRLEDALPNERDKLIVRIFGDCGLRLDELTRLVPDDVVRFNKHAYLRVLGKRNRRRDVPIPPLLLRRLERHIAVRPSARTADRIFLSQRRAPHGSYEPLTVSGVYKVVVDGVERAELGKRAHPHLLRHSWMTEMLRNGMNPIQLSIIAGASPDVIAACYTHLTKDDAYEAMLSVLARSSR